MTVGRRSSTSVARRCVGPLAAAGALLLASCSGGSLTKAGSDGGTPPPTAAPVPPSPEVAALVDGTLSDLGKRVFYRASPKVLERAEFGVACPEDELGLVLGCYANGRIYILKVTRPELAGVMEVTAAHEMLHAVYATMSFGERRRIDKQVGDFYTGVTDPELRQLVAEYEKTEPGQQLNELHSILPTEIGALSPELDQHYARYFTSRQTVVDANDRYQGVLKALEGRIEGLHAQVTDLKAQLAALDTRVTAEQAKLDDMDGRLDALKAKGSVGAFNNLVPQRNAQARSLTKLVEQYNQLVQTHNAKVDEVNGLALEQNQLVEGLAGKTPTSP